ncbi:MAG: DEAD/DEAH box helicase [Planctomycetes bacterium]|nr:DEAD/DEAH box helicase [Planctomycetota bacterium]
MDALRFLAVLENSPRYRGQIAHVHTLRTRAPRFGSLARPLPPPFEQALAARGISALYTHQCAALEHARAGQDIVLVTGTASGKTLCYNLPVLETLLTEPQARALYLFPTKALAQDQLRSLQDLSGRHEALQRVARAATYDADTPQGQRRKIRESATILLSNPDMLHAGILPAHARWARFFSQLRYVVIDELHTYRGIFGSHVANVLRRLLRLCRFYGSRPQFIACSATIANPEELAERLTGRRMQVVDDDGSPRGTKYFVLWNPPVTDQGTGARRSANVESQELLVRLLEEGVASITFTRARVLAELLYRYTRETLEEKSPKLAGRVRSYRGGYLPAERREIERQLFSGELLGVTATSALELGIDVGGLDACILVGFPGTFASTWQQAGRAGRSAEESLAVLVAHQDPIDQYLVRHPEYFFEQSAEYAVVDPDNPHILAHHLLCAAYEMPLRPEDSAFFGPLFDRLCELIARDGLLRRIDAKWYWASTLFPAGKTNLRTLSEDTYAIQDLTGGRNEVMGQVDGSRAFEVVHPEAIYLHSGESYLVRGLDLDARIARVERAETDYYTQPVVSSQVRVVEPEEERSLPGLKLVYGNVAVTRQVQGYARYKFYTLENLGHSSLDLPPRTLETKALWMIPAPEILSNLDRADDLNIPGPYRRFAALAGARNVFTAVLPLIAMCDRWDVGGIVHSTTLGEPSIFLYDRYPGGLGFSRRGYDLAEQLFQGSLRLVEECPCDQGCPSCVGRPTVPDAAPEISLEGSSWSESKAATRLLLRSVAAHV